MKATSVHKRNVQETTVMVGVLNPILHHMKVNTNMEHVVKFQIVLAGIHSVAVFSGLLALQTMVC